MAILATIQCMRNVKANRGAEDKTKKLVMDFFIIYNEHKATTNAHTDRPGRLFKRRSDSHQRRSRKKNKVETENEKKKKQKNERKSIFIYYILFVRTATRTRELCTHRLRFCTRNNVMIFEFILA